MRGPLNEYGQVVTNNLSWSHTWFCIATYLGIEEF